MIPNESEAAQVSLEAPSQAPAHPSLKSQSKERSVPLPLPPLLARTQYNRVAKSGARLESAPLHASRMHPTQKSPASHAGLAPSRKVGASASIRFGDERSGAAPARTLRALYGASRKDTRYGPRSGARVPAVDPVIVMAVVLPQQGPGRRRNARSVRVAPRRSGRPPTGARDEVCSALHAGSLVRALPTQVSAARPGIGVCLESVPPARSSAQVTLHEAECSRAILAPCYSAPRAKSAPAFRLAVGRRNTATTKGLVSQIRIASPCARAEFRGSSIWDMAAKRSSAVDPVCKRMQPARRAPSRHKSRARRGSARSV
ncbi:hypothetical protein B0H15DRAFT_948892 [Mycena belliarum]|uniref:Uncharacterized protein n=1 Tax=Mycena belliarum TaxID=1033014 RepID=A0AAD6XRR7_9AGAR|nr:hypothetical protein B0H15DRAFT_948892 [Mycena belliae]